MLPDPSALRDPTLAPAVAEEAVAEVSGPKPGIALCLSGGGYRAMLFHLGSLWRLNEFGLLPRLKHVSSVSGGSITAATLGANWQELDFDAKGVAGAFGPRLVTPIRALAGHTVDVGAVLVGSLVPFTRVGDRVVAAYRSYLFGDKTLQDLPDEGHAPRFMLNATNVQTGDLWRFCRAFMGDYRVGRVMQPRVDLAVAVAASSAFPPFLSPVHLSVRHEEVRAEPGADLHQPPYSTEVVLSDGGVYDNLGLETAFKAYDTILVSDGGAKVAPDPQPHADWARHAYRVLDLVDNQVRSLRKRMLLAALLDRSGNPRTMRKGAYWGIRTDIRDYELPDALNEEFPHERTLRLAEVPTRLERMPGDLQEQLINWGYAVCDAALRRHYPPESAPAARLPYPPSA